MLKVTRRDWLKMLLAAGAMPMTGCLSSVEKPFQSRYQHTDIRVAMAPDNPAIIFDESKCILCGACYRVCRRMMSVTGFYDLQKTGDRPICVHCGQCSTVCEGDALQNRPDWSRIQAAKAAGKVIVVSLSPAVRVMVSEAFGAAAGTYCEGEVIAALRALGVDYVLDTATGADLTIVEEAAEWVRRLTDGTAPLPQMTSCCPSWVKFAETFYPQVLPHISTTKSPIAIQGAVIKTFFAQQKGIDPKRIFNVALTPCTSKKFEILRPEHTVSGLRGMDAVITVRELADWMRASQLDYQSLQPSTFDDLMGNASGAGVIFGNTGGVSEAILRTAYFILNGVNPPEHFLAFKELRGLIGTNDRRVGALKSATIQLSAERSVNVLVIQGLANVRAVLEALEQGTLTADFIEVMACEGGCIGGGGTPRAKAAPYLTRAMRRARIEALYQGDTTRKIRLAHENPIMELLYRQQFEGTFGCEKARALLHTAYYSRAKDLGEG